MFPTENPLWLTCVVDGETCAYSLQKYGNIWAVTGNTLGLEARTPYALITALQAGPVKGFPTVLSNPVSYDGELWKLVEVYTASLKFAAYRTAIKAWVDGTATSETIDDKADLAITVGCRVQIHGIQLKPALNDTYGIVIKEVVAKGRWKVHSFQCNASLSMKPANLLVISSPAAGGKSSRFSSSSSEDSSGDDSDGSSSSSDDGIAGGGGEGGGGGSKRATADAETLLSKLLLKIPGATLTVSKPAGRNKNEEKEKAKEEQKEATAKDKKAKARAKAMANEEKKKAEDNPRIMLDSISKCFAVPTLPALPAEDDVSESAALAELAERAWRATTIAQDKFVYKTVRDHFAKVGKELGISHPAARVCHHFLKGMAVKEQQDAAAAGARTAVQNVTEVPPNFSNHQCSPRQQGTYAFNLNTERGKAGQDMVVSLYCNYQDLFQHRLKAVHTALSLYMTGYALPLCFEENGREDQLLVDISIVFVHMYGYQEYRHDQRAVAALKRIFNTPLGSVIHWYQLARGLVLATMQGNTNRYTLAPPSSNPVGYRSLRHCAHVTPYPWHIAMKDDQSLRSGYDFWKHLFQSIFSVTPAERKTMILRVADEQKIFGGNQRMASIYTCYLICQRLQSVAAAAHQNGTAPAMEALPLELWT